MKRKKICLFGAITCFSLILVGCNNDDSSSSNGASSAPSEDTTETLFLEWKAGRDAFSTYEGEHTFVDTNLDYENGVLTSKTINRGGRKDKEFYSINEEYGLDEDNVLTKDSTAIEAIKQITVEGKERTKLYREASSSEDIEKEGSYISPNYTGELYSMILQEYLEEYYISSGDSYSSLIQNINEAALDDFDAEPTSISLNRKEDGAVSLSMHFVGEYVNEFFKNENDDYLKTTFDYLYCVNVKNGFIVSFEDNERDIDIFKNDKKEDYQSSRDLSFSNSFNTEEFESISIETDETKNMYYGYVDFYIEGYPVDRSDYAYVDSTYTANQAGDCLANTNKMLGRYDTAFMDYVTKDSFKFYLDKDCTMPFTEKYIENDEGFNLYAKLILPKDSAAVVTVFQNTRRSWVFVVYLVDIGATFNRIEYDILSIDGEEWKEGDSRDIQITENRAYVVVYNTPNLAG